MAIKVTAILGTKNNGEKIQGQSWTARDAAHADRIIARQKENLQPGSSTSYEREQA